LSEVENPKSNVNNFDELAVNIGYWVLDFGRWTSDIGPLNFGHNQQAKI